MNEENTTRKHRKRTFSRGVRRFFKKGLMWMGKYIVPYLYMAYFHFIWATSKVEDRTNPLLDDALDWETKKFIAVLWHQDVMFVSFAFRRLCGTTIASLGDGGEIIARMLKLCNFTVFRGGSSKKGRRKKKILEEFTDHLKTIPKAGVGITVDGASGPPFRMKTGALVMAKETGIPLYTVRVWCKRRFLFSTWDRTNFPLPFNKILILCEGPFRVPEEIEEKGVFERFHKEMETKLLNITYEGFMTVDGAIDKEHRERFPDDWKVPGEEGEVSSEGAL